jgi:hypothetical protein
MLHLLTTEEQTKVKDVNVLTRSRLLIHFLCPAKSNRLQESSGDFIAGENTTLELSGLSSQKGVHRPYLKGNPKPTQAKKKSTLLRRKRAAKHQDV